MAINLGLGKVVLETDEVCDIQSWGNDEEEGECQPADATFVTFQMANGKWAYAIISDFNFNYAAH